MKKPRYTGKLSQPTFNGAVTPRPMAEFWRVYRHHKRNADLEAHALELARTGVPKPPTKKQARQMRDRRVLQRLLAMKPAPQPYKLAGLLAKENKSLPKADRWGTGTTMPRAMEKYIERLWKTRKASPSPTTADVVIILKP
jgi:hypothetical protein